jgi:hypothetical protein
LLDVRCSEVLVSVTPDFGREHRLRWLLELPATE